MISAHHCGRRHQAYPALANCIWPHAAWVSGNGAFACLEWCGVVSVSLHPDLAAAQLALAKVDQDGCCSRCTGRHELVRLAFEGPTS